MTAPAWPPLFPATIIDRLFRARSPPARRDLCFQLLGPVGNDADPGGRRFFFFPDHEETLAVGGDVVVGVAQPPVALVTSFEKHFGLRQTEGRLGLDFDRHHLVTTAVEDLAPVSGPDPLAATLRRDLPLPARTGNRLGVDLEAARSV